MLESSSRFGPPELARLDEVAVLAGKTDRATARAVDRGDDLFVDLSGKHHLDDFHRRRVGNPQPIDELALHFQAIEHLPDLRAAAVHDHRVYANLLQQHDVLGEELRELRVPHGVAAVLNDESLAGVAAHEGQSLGQGPGGLKPFLGFRYRPLFHGRNDVPCCGGGDSSLKNALRPGPRWQRAIR